jgi:hypothetical protein
VIDDAVRAFREAGGATSSFGTAPRAIRRRRMTCICARFPPLPPPSAARRFSDHTGHGRGPGRRGPGRMHGGEALHPGSGPARAGPLVFLHA